MSNPSQRHPESGALPFRYLHQSGPAHPTSTTSPLARELLVHQHGIWNMLYLRLRAAERLIHDMDHSAIPFTPEGRSQIHAQLKHVNELEWRAAKGHPPRPRSSPISAHAGRPAAGEQSSEEAQRGGDWRRAVERLEKLVDEDLEKGKRDRLDWIQQTLKQLQSELDRLHPEPGSPEAENRDSLLDEVDAEIDQDHHEKTARQLVDDVLAVTHYSWRADELLGESRRHHGADSQPLAARSRTHSETPIGLIPPHASPRARVPMHLSPPTTFRRLRLSPLIDGAPQSRIKSLEELNSFVTSVQASPVPFTAGEMGRITGEQRLAADDAEDLAAAVSNSRQSLERAGHHRGQVRELENALQTATSHLARVIEQALQTSRQRRILWIRQSITKLMTEADKVQPHEMHAFIQDLLGFKADFDAYQTYWQDLERQPDNVILDLSVHIFGTLARMAEMQKRLSKYRFDSRANAAFAGHYGAGSSASQSTTLSLAHAHPLSARRAGLLGVYQ